MDVKQTAILLREIAAHNGEPFNASSTARQLGLSAAAVRYRVALLEKAQLIRVLPSLARRRPHLLLRDGRLLMDLGGTPEAVLHTCLTQCIIVGLSCTARHVRFFQWETGRTKRVDLVACTAVEKVGFRLAGDLFLRNQDVACLRIGIDRGLIDRGYLVYCGSHACFAERRVIALPVPDFILHIDRWLACTSFPEARDVFHEVGAGTPRTLAQRPSPPIMRPPGV
jgi:hypothetical protein